MKQHLIDLMPASIRARSQAGMRTSRFVAAACIVMIATIVVATHSRVRVTSAQQNLATTKSQAEEVFALDAKAAELKKALAQSRTYIDVYEQVAYPIEVSAVLATVVNALPHSVTLEQIDVDAGIRSAGRSPRARTGDTKSETLPRILTCEISGFASSDEHIAELVKRLEATSPFCNVNLDFTRTRKVNDLDAREFRLSFRIDLNRRYEVAYVDGAAPQHGSMGRVVDAAPREDFTNAH